MSKPDPIEIKVNIAGDVDRALAALGLGEGEPREVWFLDDLTDGARPPLPLLNAGIVLRLRRKGGGGKAGDRAGNKPKEDSTVKLRPCRRSQLISPWDARPAEDSDYRIEGDWSRTSHVLAASYVSELAPGDIADALDGGHLAKAFTGPQRAFLSDCGAVAVALSGVTALKPIASRVWKDFTLGAVEHVDAERWTVAGLDFLELSIRVTTGEGDAVKQQFVLAEAVLERGLEFDDSDAPKTVRVMRRLAGLD